MALKDVRQIIKKTKSVKKSNKLIPSKRKRGGDNSDQCISLVMQSMNQFLLELKKHIPLHMCMIENDNYTKFTFIQKILTNQKIINYIKTEIEKILSIIYKQLTENRISEYCMIHAFLNDILENNIKFKIDILNRFIESKEVLVKILEMHKKRMIDINNLFNLMIPYIINTEQQYTPSTESIFNNFANDIIQLMYNILAKLYDNKFETILNICIDFCKNIKFNDDSLQIINSYVSINVKKHIQKYSKIIDILQRINLKELFEALQQNETNLMNLIEKSIDNQSNNNAINFSMIGDFVNSFEMFGNIFQNVIQQYNKLYDLHTEIQNIKKKGCT